VKLLLTKRYASLGDEDIVYSPAKYRETEGIKDKIGLFYSNIKLERSEHKKNVGFDISKLTVNI